MKSLKALLLIGSIFFALTSCNNDAAEITPEILTDSEAQDIVVESLTQDNAGLVLELDVLSGDIDGVLDLTSPLNSGELSGGLSDYCGETQSRTKSGSFSGPNVSWDYDYQWSRTLICDESESPQYFDVTWDAERNYENNVRISNAVADGDWTVHFLDQYSVKQYNGDYTRNVDRQAKNSDRFKLIELDVNIVDVNVKRADKYILGGTLFFTITGENNTGNTFSRSGKAIFNGDCTATITMDNGNSRTVTIC